ncbi:MAG TPA: dienelactone hydrolase family protein [Gillisia sp.]|nr:dienelactone hydrolase family protein [Gillisia sp.]
MKNSLKIMFLGVFSFLIFSCGNKKKEQSETSAVKSETTVQQTEVEELSASPRHQEWITLKHGDREFQAFVVYPETDVKTKSIILIHENRGLNDWARLFADKLAAEGYLVIAPDLLSNTQEGKKRTTDFENPDAARDAIYALNPEQVTADLDAAFQYIKNDASSTGEVAVVGFCWGGSQTFRYATTNKNISSAHVFYGTAPENAEALSEISAPVYGYYGGDDNRVNATIEQTEKLMKAAGKTYEYEIYKGAGHAFMRSGSQPDADKANREAHNAAGKRLLDLLKK